MPADPAPPSPLDESERRALRIEVVIVLALTFGASGLSAALSLLESALQPGGVGGRTVALNASRADQPLLDVLRLVAWAALGLYLLWRSGIGPKMIGLARDHRRGDLLAGLGFTALIGLPGLGLYLLAQALGFSVTIVPSSLGEHWWRLPVLILSACANSAAEEIIVVGYLLTRLRTLGWSENSSLLASALLRGNVVMGLIFGRWWQRTGRLWPLLVAHALIDTIAYVGYTVLRGHVGWLP